MRLRYEHLEGLEFKHGKRDCYELVRDFYRENFRLNLRNYARPDNWWDHGMNLYMDNYRKEGFRLVDCAPHDIRVGDVILMAIHSQVPNHAAIYVGNGKILHHAIGRRSECELYKGLWFNTTVAVIRHPEVNFQPEYTTATIMELRDARSQGRTA